MPRPASRLIVHGHVQGVGYRWWTVREADRLGLEGWVRNRADGGVEILAIGPEEDIERLVAACLQGPAGAGVVAVESFPAEDDGSPGFGQRPTV
jgi:acylphosphatase